MSTGKDFRKDLLEAYVKKAEVKAKYTKERQDEATRPIRPLSPFSHHPEKLSTLGSTGGNVIIGSPTRAPVPGDDQWWRKSPTIAGEAQTSAQQRLSSPESFTGMYRKRFEPATEPIAAHNVSGDIVTNPRRAMTLLKDTAPKDLTIPTRACDFRTEVEWRLSLRNPEDEHHGRGHRHRAQEYY